MKDSKINILVKKGQKIKSKRTGKELDCYSVMSVFVGQSNEVSRYDYSFWDAKTKKSQTIKQSDLKNKLNGVWSILK